VTGGYLGNLAANPAYAESTKNWQATLQQSSRYWYDLIVNPPDFVNTKGGIATHHRTAKIISRVEKNGSGLFVLCAKESMGLALFVFPTLLKRVMCAHAIPGSPTP
jgi:hypothetical protein